MIIPFLILFILIEVIQAWLMLFEKRLLRGVKLLVISELMESPLILYLILRGEPSVIFIVVSIEIIQWLAIAILFNLQD